MLYYICRGNVWKQKSFKDCRSLFSPSSLPPISAFQRALALLTTDAQRGKKQICESPENTPGEPSMSVSEEGQQLEKANDDGCLRSMLGLHSCIRLGLESQGCHMLRLPQRHWKAGSCFQHSMFMKQGIATKMRLWSRLHVSNTLQCHCHLSPQMGPSSCRKTDSELPWLCVMMSLIIISLYLTM